MRLPLIAPVSLSFEVPSPLITAGFGPRRRRLSSAGEADGNILGRRTAETPVTGLFWIDPLFATVADCLAPE